MFAKVTVFSVRKDDLKRDKNGDIISRKWVCSKKDINWQSVFEIKINMTRDHWLDLVVKLFFVLILIENWRSGLLKS